MRDPDRYLPDPGVDDDDKCQVCGETCEDPLLSQCDRCRYGDDDDSVYPRPRED